MNLVDSLSGLDLSEAPRERVNDARSAKRSRQNERVVQAPLPPNPERYALLISNVYHKALSRQSTLQNMLERSPALFHNGLYVQTCQRVQSILQHCLHCNDLLTSNTPANLRLVFSQKESLVSSFLWLVRTE